MRACGVSGSVVSGASFPLCTPDLHSFGKHQNCLIPQICYWKGLFLKYCCFSLYIKYLGGSGEFDLWLKLNSEGVINPRGFLGATCQLLLNCKPTFTNNYNIGFAEITHNDFSQSCHLRTEGTLGPSK